MGADPIGSWTATKREEGFRGHCAYLMTGKVHAVGVDTPETSAGD